jgi:hypothetical protein
MTETLSVTSAWREKLIACGIHFLATVVLAAIAAGLIFIVWYPPPYTQMLGGMELFMLVVGSDLVLGPLMSLVIYDSRKSRRALVTDYSIVGVIQIAAVAYGVWIMSGARPVYMAFTVDRYEVVQASDLTADELAAARDPRYSSRPLLGARYVSVVVPKDEQQESLFKSLEDKDIHMRPRFYVPYEMELPRILQRAAKMEDLVAKHADAKPAIEAARRDAGIPEEYQRWLPIHYATGFWTAVIDSRTGYPVSYIDLDPY